MSFAWLPTYCSLITSNAGIYGFDPSWIASIIQAESGGNPNALSSAGAVGLMQVIPSPIIPGRPTAQQLLDPATNIQWGVSIFNEGWQAFGDIALALAAYNCGIGCVQACLNYIPCMPAQTQAYIPIVEGYFPQAAALFPCGSGGGGGGGGGGCDPADLFCQAAAWWNGLDPFSQIAAGFFLSVVLEKLL